MKKQVSVPLSININPPDQKFLPQWTKRAKMEMGGRDPLGLSRVSQMITDNLLSGIITTTYRARYYSFYCWALWHVQKEKEDFIDGLRRREAVMALATVRNNSETTLSGIEATEAEIERSSSEDYFNCDFKVLPSNSYGGYGQYYAGSISALGLTGLSDEANDIVSKPKGELLAQIHHETISRTPYIQKKLFGKPRIQKDILDNSAKFLTLDALNESFTRAERNALIDILFGRKESQNESTRRRRHTLSLILNTISICQKHGIEVKTTGNFDSVIVYQPYYYEKLKGENGRLFSYEYPRIFSECVALWRQFCVHQYLTQALETFLYCVLELTGSEPMGLSLEMVLDRLITDDYLIHLKDLTGKSCENPIELLKALQIESVPDQINCYSMRRKIGLEHSLGEANLLSDNIEKLSLLAAEATLLLAVLYAKWRGATDDKAMREIAEHAGSQLWAGNFLPEIDKWLTSTDWKSPLRYLLHTYLVKQHDQIMFEKRRLDSCWLHQHEGRLIKDQDYEPTLRSSRHWNAVSILRDLGLLNINKNNIITITREGRNLLAEAAEASET